MRLHNFIIILIFGLIAGLISCCQTCRVNYDIYGLSYGHSYYWEDKVLLGGSDEKPIPFEWIFWVVKGNGKIILVDTGFDDLKKAKKWHISNYINPIERLAQLGILPSQVTDVILTHSDWDHMGCVSQYKNAKIWIQEIEYDYIKSKRMDWDVAKENLRLVNGRERIIPGIVTTLDGSHTPGHQYITVKTIYGAVIIAGDATYLYKNNLREIPIARSVDHEANLAAIKNMRKQAASEFLILPGHDPLVMKLFPQVSEGIVRITSGMPLKELSKKATAYLNMNK